MNKKTSIWYVLVLLMGLVTWGGLVNSPTVYSANKQEKKILSDYNRKQCVGSQCVFIATWLDAIEDKGWQVIDASLTMSTFALEFGITSQSGEVTTQLTHGESFTVPIDAGGEIVGYAARFVDSPPIQFKPGGVVEAETAGLSGCSVAGTTLGQGGLADVAKEDSRDCKEITILDSEDIVGTWQDHWRAYDTAGHPMPAVSCQTDAGGLFATCSSTDKATGTVRLELTRTVNDFIWKNFRVRWSPGKVPVIAIGGNIIHRGEQTSSFVGVQNPFPGSMISSVMVNFVPSDPNATFSPTPSGTPQCSDGVDNDNDALVDCADFGCWQNQQDSSTCDPNDNSESNVPGFSPGPFQEHD